MLILHEVLQVFFSGPHVDEEANAITEKVDMVKVNEMSVRSL